MFALFCRQISALLCRRSFVGKLVRYYVCAVLSALLCLRYFVVRSFDGVPIMGTPSESRTPQEVFMPQSVGTHSFGDPLYTKLRLAPLLYNSYCRWRPNM